MPVKAGFAETDITPPLGIRKIGWTHELFADAILDPLLARAAIIESGEARVAYVQLDTIGIMRPQTIDIRRRIEERYGFPGGSVMLAGTHNHAGPDVREDEAYIETLTSKVVEMFGRAIENLKKAELGFGSVFEWEVSYNRRVAMRDGTTKTQHSFAKDPNCLYIEGPIDPEVAVLAARGKDGRLLGVIVNFALHVTQHGGTGEITAGFPGVLANVMKDRGCPVTLFLNGAAGNIHAGDVRGTKPEKTIEETGTILADDVVKALDGMRFRSDVKIGARSRMIDLPFREVTDDVLNDRVKGAQRFHQADFLKPRLEKLVEKIRDMGGIQPAEVQVFSFDERDFVALPCEYFVQNGFLIKEGAWPRRALVVAYANDSLGYVPHEEAFPRGGYEASFGSSRLAPQAGRMLADCALEIIRGE